MPPESRRFVLLVATAVIVANPIAHVVRAVDGVSYRSLHPINVGLGLSLGLLALGWGRFLVTEPWRAGLRPVLSRSWPLFALAAFAALTSPWSMAPLRSFAWAAHLMIMTVAACVVASAFGVQTIRRATLVALLVLLAASALMVFVAPYYGRNDDAIYRGAWRGVFAGKNHLGLVAGLALVVAAVTPATAVLRLATAGLAAVTLVGARSAVGVVTAAAGLGVAFAVPLLSRFAPRPRRLVVVVGALAGLAVLLTLVPGWRTITTALGRDPSLTGRTVLWEHVVARVAERPLTGYGLRGYFESDLDETELQAAMNEATALVRKAAPPRVVLRKLQPTKRGRSGSGAGARGVSEMEILPEPKWKISHAHNGVLHIALDLGLPAAVLLLGWIFVRSLPALRRALNGGATGEDVALLALVAALAAHNLGEVSLLRSWHPEALVWMLAVVHLLSAPRAGEA